MPPRRQRCFWRIRFGFQKLLIQFCNGQPFGFLDQSGTLQPLAQIVWNLLQPICQKTVRLAGLLLLYQTFNHTANRFSHALV
ncbi:MAG: hypothetical protein IJF84_09165 [Thermoguttaceae bacterium]|nr:hypothetical protein [Thermoguttaceae bacterium]